MRPDLRPALLTAAIIAALALSLATPARGEESREAAPKNPHGSFKAECSLCHGPKAWKPARISKEFDHGKFSFPLVGAHAAAGCRACHESLDFAKAPAICASCHQDVHAGELGIDCARCHTSRSFIDRIGMVRAHQATRFPLIGAHAGIDCDGCHRPEPTGHLRYVGLQVECVSCHMKDFQATTTPSHTAGGFSFDCRMCHTMMTWTTARFDHRGTGFPLTGAHAPLACERCHVGGVFTGLSAACVSCHQGDYDATTNPAHSGAGFPTTCETCHSTSSWAGASFNHASTGFPLTGAHTPLPCASCHVGGVYTGLSPACVSCHQNDYDTTTDPAHAAAGFSTTCETCHSTSNWNGSFPQHDAQFFPIYSGTHRGRWSLCSQCHTQASNYAVFACLTCHPHSDKAETDSHHSGMGAYQYNSQACYQCHPTGRAG